MGTGGYHCQACRQCARHLRRKHTATVERPAGSLSLIHISKVSIPDSQLRVGQILSQIESQTDYLFVYNKKSVDVRRTVNVCLLYTSLLLRGTGILHSLYYYIIKILRTVSMRIIIVQAGCHCSKALHIIFITVSYTHLDVYKRQMPN